MRRKPPKSADEKKKAGVNEHTAGLGNVLEGKAAEEAKPKRKRQRKRPSLGAAYAIKN